MSFRIQICRELTRNYVKMRGPFRNRTWHRERPYETRAKSTTGKRESVPEDAKNPGKNTSSSTSPSSTAASGERGWDYLLRRKAEDINDRIHKSKAADGYSETAEVFAQFVPKEEPGSSSSYEPWSNQYSSFSQAGPPLQGINASHNYAENERFFIDTTGERYREETEMKQQFSRSTNAQERSRRTATNHHLTMETPWDWRYPECHSSDAANQLSDQRLTQNIELEDGRSDTKQGVGNRLSVQTLIANIRNAVATNPNFKKNKHDSVVNQALSSTISNDVEDERASTKPSFEIKKEMGEIPARNYSTYHPSETLTYHTPNDAIGTYHTTGKDSKRNMCDSAANQTSTCNVLNLLKDGEDVSHATKQNSERNKQTSASKKTLFHSLPYPAEGVDVVYTVDPVEAEVWLRNNIIDCSAEAVGFDIEWKPQFVSKKKGGVEHKTAVLQLGVESSCLVLHLHNMKSPPKLLRTILEDKKIFKVGSGIVPDATKLKRDTGLLCKGMVDTQKMAKSVGIPVSQKLGLKALAERFLGVNLEKPNYVSRSNWEKYPLTIRQIHYAALDAWIGFKVYQHMKLMSGPDQTHLVETEIVDDEVVKKPTGGIVHCHVCNKKCKGQDALANHIKIHTQCKCGRFFVANISKSHKKKCPARNPVMAHAQAASESTVCCQGCGKKCSNATNLMEHIREVGHVQCPFCTRLLQGPKSNEHIMRCKHIINDQWQNC